MRKIFETPLRLLKFSTSTLAGTTVDMLVLWLFAHIIFGDKGFYFEYWLSPVISFESACLANFVIAYYFVWKDRVSKRSKRSFLRHFMGYNLSSTGGFMIKQAVLLLFQRIFKWDVLICNLAALCVSGGVNFVLNEFVVFGKRKTRPEDFIEMDEDNNVLTVSEEQVGNQN